MRRIVLLTISLLFLAVPAQAAPSKFINCINANGQIFAKRKCSLKKGERQLTLAELGTSVTAPQGPKGEQGLPGEKGEKGDTGEKGDIGPDLVAPEIVTFRGPWDPAVTYNQFDLVSSDTPDIYFFTEVGGSIGKKPEENPGAWTGADLSQLKLIRKTLSTTTFFSLPIVQLVGAGGGREVASVGMDYTIKVTSPAAAIAESGHIRALIIGFEGGGAVSTCIPPDNKINLGALNSGCATTFNSGTFGLAYTANPTLANFNAVELVFHLTNLSTENGIRMRLVP